VTSSSGEVEVAGCGVERQAALAFEFGDNPKLGTDGASGNPFNGLLSIEQIGDLASERGRMEQKVFGIRKRDARPIVANAVGVFSQIDGGIADCESMEPDGLRRLWVQIGGVQVFVSG
jgi:hypothetical protein